MATKQNMSVAQVDAIVSGIMKTKQPEVEPTYITDHKFDKILNQYRQEIKSEDVRHAQTKKQIIIKYAKKLEKEGYPTNQICDRLSKSSSGLGFGDSYVRKCLEEKYKNPIKMAEALSQNHGRDTLYHDMQRVAKKELKQMVLHDIKYLTLPKAKQLVKYLIHRCEWWEQQAKQFEAKVRELERKQDEDKQ